MRYGKHIILSPAMVVIGFQAVTFPSKLKRVKSEILNSIIGIIL